MANKGKITAVVAAFLILVAGIVLQAGDYPQKLIDSEVNKQLVISMDSPEYNDWVNPPPPIYMQYWLFNVTNPKEVVKGGKANVTQVGPYTYRLYQPRFNVIFYQNNSVSYQYNHTLVFQRDMSVGDHEKDLITNLNVPLISVSSMLHDLSPFLLKFLKKLIEVLGDSQLFIKHTPKEFLFGYTDPLLEMAHLAFEIIGKDFPGEFGAFYGFNNTDDGVYLAHTGKSNISHTNSIERWNYNTHLDYWNTRYANALNGTDGVFYYPGLKTTDEIFAFSTDICRSLPFSFEKKTEVKKLKTLRFHTTKKAFGNTSVNPDNADFCTPPGNCLDSGVLNISGCKQNAPVIISSPHFYLGAEQYIHGVNGLRPQKEQHETYLDIEPTTGTVLRANKRLQVNIYLTKSNFSDELSKVRTTVFPFLWLNESVTVDNGSADHLRGLFSLKRFVLAIPFILFGITALIVFIILTVHFVRRKDKTYSVITDDDLGEEDKGTGKQ